MGLFFFLRSSAWFSMFLRGKQRDTPRSKLLSSQEEVMELRYSFLSPTQNGWGGKCRPSSSASDPLGSQRPLWDESPMLTPVWTISPTFTCCTGISWSQTCDLVTCWWAASKNSAPELLSKTADVSEWQICGVFQLQSPKTSAHLTATVDPPATPAVEDDLSPTVTEQQPPLTPQKASWHPLLNLTLLLKLKLKRIYMGNLIRRKSKNQNQFLLSCCSFSCSLYSSHSAFGLYCGFTSTCFCTLPTESPVTNRKVHSKETSVVYITCHQCCIDQPEVQLT